MNNFSAMLNDCDNATNCSLSDYDEAKDDVVITPMGLFLLALEMFAALLTVVLNGFIVIIVAFMIKKKTFSNCLFLVMAQADFIVGLASYPLYAVQKYFDGEWRLGKAVCIMWSVSDYSSCSISIYCLCAISMHRWIQLNYPTHASEDMNFTKYIVIGAMVFVTYAYWAIAFTIFSFLPEFELVYCDFTFRPIFNLVSTLINYALPTLLTFLINLLNFIKMRQRMKQKKAKGIMHVTSHAHTNNTDHISSVNPIPVRKPTKPKLDKDLKALLALVTITSSLVLFQSIFVVTWPYASFCPDCVNQSLLEVGYWFTYVNATVNPILLFIFHRNFQTQFYVLIRKLFCLKNTTTSHR